MFKAEKILLRGQKFTIKSYVSAMIYLMFEAEWTVPRQQISYEFTLKKISFS